MKICDFTMPELEKFRSQCNFTKDEAELLNVSTSTAKRISKRVSAKMNRV